MKAYQRLLSYVKISTPSNEESASSPSSQCQFDLARLLVEELKDLGISDVSLDEHCYVYAHLPATKGLEHCKALGFIAHMDTVSDFCDHTVTPVVTEDYDGRELPLGTSGRTLSPEMFPHLASLAGRTLITSDGTTILGADDKAGIAEIVTALEHILTEKIPHGPLCVAFTPDEEIGMGPAHFDVKKFGADYAYTLDGDTEGEIQYENFNACSAKVTFQGVNVHPGSSKNTMVNAALVAMEFNSMLPSADTPRNTADYECTGEVQRADDDHAAGVVAISRTSSSVLKSYKIVSYLSRTISRFFSAVSRLLFIRSDRFSFNRCCILICEIIAKIKTGINAVKRKFVINLRFRVPRICPFFPCLN